MLGSQLDENSDSFGTLLLQPQRRHHHDLIHGNFIAPPPIILAQLVLDAASTAPPNLSRRFTDMSQQIGTALASALADSICSGAVSGVHAGAVPLHLLTHKRICHAAALTSPQLAIDTPLRDCLLQYLATSLVSASAEEIGAVARVAHSIGEQLLLQCSRAIPCYEKSVGDQHRVAGKQASSRRRNRAETRDCHFQYCSDGEQEEPSLQQQRSRAVPLGCPKLDQMLSPKHRGFLRGQVHEVYGEAGCGKSTWAAQLLLHTLRRAHAANSSNMMQQQLIVDDDDDNDGNDRMTGEKDDGEEETQGESDTQKPQKESNREGNSRQCELPSVVLLSAEPVSAQRIEQIARAEWAQLQRQKEQSLQQQPQQQPASPLCDSSAWRTLLNGFLIVELRHIEHFESSVRMMISQHEANGECKDTPLIVLDSVAALVEKSLSCGGGATKSSSSTVVGASFFDDRASDPAEKSEYIERVGTALRMMAWKLNSAVVVINQARWSGPESERAAASLGSTGASRASAGATSLAGLQYAAAIASASSNRTSGGAAFALVAGNVQPALGYQWSTFVTGCSVELSRPARSAGIGGGALPASRRWARLVRSSTSGPAGPVDFDLVASGITDNASANRNY